MSYNVIITQRFEKELKRLVKKFPSLKNEFAAFIADIVIKPTMGTLIGNNCYKIRFAIGSKSKGKRGGARVITHLYVATETVYLLTIYDKSEKHDLKPNELKDLLLNLALDA